MRSADGINLFDKSWEIANAKAKICLIHGMGEHISRYEHLAQFFNKNGISVYGFDHRGHGHSAGIRGHAPSFSHLINDVNLFITQTNKKQKGIPTILYGHSMGGNVALNYAILHPNSIQACIATGPWIKLAFSPPAIQVFFAKLIRNLTPWITQKTKLDTKAISSDPAVVEAYEKDPLIHDTISIAMGVDLMKYGQKLFDHKEKLRIPVLIMHGSEDRITSHDASVAFADNHKEVVFKSWNNLYHEIHNESVKEDVFDFTLNWINAAIDQL